MGGGDLYLSDKEDYDVEDAPDILSRFSLVDAPILLFACFHKALRSELDRLRGFAETASFEDDPTRCREIILKLQQHFLFLKLAFKYHCAAEDEVIFQALDIHVIDGVCTYSLEHNSANGLFDSIFRFLDELMGPNQSISKPFQELVHCIGILQTSVYQHMLKEKEQVFPLLIRKLSTKEQASLVWQFICSVPIVLLEEVLPWMASFLSVDKQAEVSRCLNEIAPLEEALQEVLISWLGSKKQTFSETYFQSEEFQGVRGFLHMERSLGHSSCNANLEEISSQMSLNGQETEDGVNRVNIIHLWHNAIKKDLKEILQELHLMRNSCCFQNFDSILIQLQFLADVLISYSDALKKFFCPIPIKHVFDRFSKFTESFLAESHIEEIQQLLFYNSESGLLLTIFVEKLWRKLESFVTVIDKQFVFQETEVFPVIRRNGRNVMQVRLLSLSLHMMPLGLLKCVITWFSVHLSEKESKSFLYCLKEGDNYICKDFTPLLREWFRICYSGKTSAEKFRQQLKHMFKRRYSFSPEKVKEATGFSFLNSDKHPHKSPGKNCLSYSSASGSNNVNNRWIIRQQIPSTEVNVKSDGQELPGKHPSYRDPLKQIFGCKHYKRNCKLLAPCCNQLHACIHCHDDVSDHLIDRKSVTKMMCMKCLTIQPINSRCSTISCRNLSMAKYYCNICKIFDDDREIYHCPYCNLCRVGKGLGVDYFHCMTCNACMSRSFVMRHTCREKCLEVNCPICDEYIFTSRSPVKALPCGHVMHVTCFQEYTCCNYTCPICSKSLGDMQVYFKMLDELLAEENIPDEFSGQSQVILCNDCEKKGEAPFHWLYHKCPSCGSYNTRVL